MSNAREPEVFRPDDKLPQAQNGGGLDAVSAQSAEHARAMVESRFVMAVKRPRDLNDVRTRILKECKRPSFAESAIYRLPVGGGQEGLSIRAAERFLQQYGNARADATVVFEDADSQLLRCEAIDLETNVSFSVDMKVPKVVERNSLRDGQVPRGKRTNSYGKQVYLVEASDDEIRRAAARQASMGLRGAILRLIPGDILDEARGAIEATRANAQAEDPDAYLKRVVDAFATLHVNPPDLAWYLGVEVDKATQAQVRELRALFEAMKGGETDWSTVKRMRAEDRGEIASDDKKQDRDPNAARLRERLALAGKAGAQAKAKEEAKTSGSKGQFGTDVEPPRDDDEPGSRG